LGDLGFCKIAPKISANKDGIKANGGTMNIKLTPNETQIFHQLQQAAWTLQSLPADLQSRTSLHRDLKLALGKFVRIQGRNSLM